MAEQTIYFSKITVDSLEVYEIQKDRNVLYLIANTIMRSMEDDISFVRTGLYKNDEGQTYEEETTYTVKILDKSNGVIIGKIYKKSFIYVKSFDDFTNEIRVTPVENTEDIKFYYDVMKEYVGFHIRNRFGRNQFNSAFAELINTALRNIGETISVTVNTYSKGISLEEIKSELYDMKDLKKLTLIFQPINPDNPIVDAVENGIHEYNASTELEEANATYRSIVYEAKGLGILNPRSRLIQNDLNIIDNMNSELKAEELTKRGYVKVNVEDSTGQINTTSEKKPFKKKINNELEFEYACREGIIYILRRDMD